ncbi:phage integrase family protein [Nitrosomonas sp. PY1]|uniref:tyrosine-type recombinase/integrase n=1 Tax=Nitrosomonas sp. PY1 TaxID=1803906 RepID=UPI001FC86F0A|nr:integrase family protein [Nitrosomonas sp. PY1]GKS70002.1 phage integrase family protein [Nitrosomonas sp. PY1]
MTTPQTLPQKITKSYVNKLSTPETGQAFVRDSELKGFAVRVTSAGAKSFILEKRIDGKVKRLTLGRYPELTVEQARKKAHKLLGHIAIGRNPVAERKQESLQGTTLKQAFDDFVKTRKNLKERTLYDYRRVMSIIFTDWQDKPMININKDMVSKRHNKIGSERGEAYANLSMRFLRALFNFAIAQYEDGNGKSILHENPVVRLTQTRAWYRVDRRQTVIKPHELKPWFQAIMNLKNDPLSQNRETIRDYLLLVIFTGLRREEAASMTWDNVDLQSKTLKATDTKNHLDHTLPLSDFLYDLLQQRKNNATNEYVFQRASGTGYVSEQRKQIAKVIKESGISFTIHDLRRTFLTVAESLDISAYAVKRLANHKMSNDVTAGYIVADVERLRQPMQKITDYILKCAGYKPSATVTDFPIKNLQGNT